MKPFVNEEQPSVFLPFPANLAEINRIEVETQSFSEDALVLNTVLKDSSGGDIGRDTESYAKTGTVKFPSR